ncbi:ejaculatory bulb-specific protein 3-like [Bicyclus anynana]|uniref:Ejaculatory bulb-specific protein 3-like n=1 Tax=Bicyclus anynana TaxID=110368 RepID=A0A6J1N6L7_BICAN|nr:ejaculatory bulb-specific protein 3-like [Bicyclus anynana]
MKVLILFALCALAAAEDYYTTGNDYLDVDAFFADNKLPKEYMECYMDRGPCPELAASYKKIIPEAVEQACKKCSSPQRHIFGKYLQGLKTLYPEDYQNFKKKYDPDNKYFDALEKVLSNY